MWKPAQRIKYRPASGHWPSRQEAASSLLFSPLRYRALDLAQRTWVPAMVPWRATEDGEVSEDVLQWYGRFAQGRPGAIVVEATGIRDIPSGPLLRIGHDRYLDGLRELVETVRRASEGQTRLYIQLIDFLTVRRRPAPETYFQRFMPITAALRELAGPRAATEQELRDFAGSLDEQTLRQALGEREYESYSMGYRERVTDMHLAHIRELPALLPRLFARAALRARQAGFDGLELHFAHAYTMASFLSATNTRDDGYGGPREQRVRLPLEVYRQVREAVGDDYVVGSRILSEECIAGGSTVADSSYFAEQFARAGMDFLSLSRGGKFDDGKQPKQGEAIYPYTGPSGYECMPQYLSDERGPFGRNLGPGALIRGRLRDAGLQMPVVNAGGIHNFEQAESVLASGQADIVGLARQALADPDWFLKVKTGCGEQVRLCEYTNYCEGLDQKHKQVTCQLWDRLELDEPGIRKSRDGRRRLIAPPWRERPGDSEPT